MTVIFKQVSLRWVDVLEGRLIPSNSLISILIFGNHDGGCHAAKYLDAMLTESEKEQEDQKKMNMRTEQTRASGKHSSPMLLIRYRSAGDP